MQLNVLLLVTVSNVHICELSDSQEEPVTLKRSTGFWISSHKQLYDSQSYWRHWKVDKEICHKVRQFEFYSCSIIKVIIYLLVSVCLMTEELHQAFRCWTFVSKVQTEIDVAHTGRDQQLPWRHCTNCPRLSGKASLLLSSSPRRVLEKCLNC